MYTREVRNLNCDNLYRLRKANSEVCIWSQSISKEPLDSASGHFGQMSNWREILVFLGKRHGLIFNVVLMLFHTFLDKY